MLYFSLVSSKYKKYFFCLKDYNHKKHITLLDYYFDRYHHLIPIDVIFIEYDEKDDNISVFSYNHEKKRYSKDENGY